MYERSDFILFSHKSIQQYIQQSWKNSRVNLKYDNDEFAICHGCDVYVQNISLWAKTSNNKNNNNPSKYG